MFCKTQYSSTPTSIPLHARNLFSLSVVSNGIGANLCRPAGSVKSITQAQIGLEMKKRANPLARVCPFPFVYWNRSWSYFLPLLPNSSAPHFFAVASNTSLLDSATGGKSFIHSYGRVASMMARELKPFLVG